MSKGKYASNRSRSSKSLVLVLALVMLITATVGGTLAWLSAESNEVENTFTSAKLFDNPTADFTLWEHEAKDENQDGDYTLDQNSEVMANNYNILPGVTIPKDPTVDIVNLKEHAYLYIKVTSTLPEGMTWSVDANNWEALDDYEGIWVYKGENAEDNVIKASKTSPKSFTATILTDNKISVADNYTGTDNANLSFDAYMVQATGSGENAAEAWGKTFGNTTP